MPDTIESNGMIWGTMIADRSYEDFTAIQMVIEPCYSAFDLFTRYEHTSYGVTFSDWSWRDVKKGLPEAETLTTGLIERCRNNSWYWGLSATIAVGMSRDLIRLHDRRSILPVNCSFYRVLGDIARVDPEDIKLPFQGIYLSLTGVTPLYIFLRKLLWNWNPPEVLDQMLQTSIKHRATILYNSGVDLLQYGNKEQSSFQDIGCFVSEETIWRSESEGHPREIPYTCSLLGITYGSLPEQWRLWWAPNINDYAADFWNLVEDSSSNPSGFSVPGGWADGFDEDSDDVHGEKASFIWSEYRKIRPPI